MMFLFIVYLIFSRYFFNFLLQKVAHKSNSVKNHESKILKILEVGADLRARPFKKYWKPV